MPREIKFRVWMPVHERMSDCFTIKDFIKMGQGSFSGTTDNIFLEYTGLKDRTKIEIFEGNIVKYKSSCIGDPNENMVGVVSYLEAQFFIVNEKEQRAIPLFTETAELEVIGNIYEHPELLHR